MIDVEYLAQLAEEYDHIDIVGFVKELSEWQHEENLDKRILLALDTVYDIFIDHLEE